ncbi:MAG: thioredoxin [Sphingobacteriales bacterium]|nr:thioredoxin [Sphingobacteriales bacterium]OJY91112.1 MAG: thioredoxin [Sphingobacteriales bacterium 44-15]
MTFNEMIQSSKPVLVDFSAEWCGPCKMMAPILKDVKKEIGETAAIIKVDVDKNPVAAQQFQIQGVPTLILFKEGKLLWRQSGVVPKAGLVEVIKKYAS